MTSVLCIEVIG